MATAAAHDWRATVREGVGRTVGWASGLALIGLAVLLALALGSHRGTDPSFDTAAAGPPANLIGWPGAYVADALLMLAGPAAALVVPLVFALGWKLWRGEPTVGWRATLATGAGAIALGAVAVALWRGPVPGQLPGGPGGAIGLLGAGLVEWALGFAGEGVRPWLRIGLATVLALGALGLAMAALSIARPRWTALRDRLPALPPPGGEAAGSDEPAEVEPVAPPAARSPRLPTLPRKSRPKIADRSDAPAPMAPPKRQEQLDLRDDYQLPSLELLTQAPAPSGAALDKAGLERNARLLESVLDDFHVKGEIVEVRPGPIVTMYELDPAPGIKATRVISLGDDIARNMSATSARIATIPGRTVIGIELPNQRREAVVLRELVASAAFNEQASKLPIVLGKNISGDPVVADLAPMPHLLVAGTTGSGKSVGLNCMILSLLYRLSPTDLRLIMIDPKMLELSMYEDIPHLLAPVVTEPAKAVRALKWAVEQMEERYRMMATAGVRSLDSFNDKVREAKRRGRPLGRRVQTGHDEDGKPVYEDEELDYDLLPQIVVIVDELADLMMTAGKEVEFLIQRLAQKARAAGIHLIMATQRPSVDVITGVIKANLPTRISFQVTSKIDSRTILGEQGAEQLLGKGDMLYMPGGKQVSRVHGPFVSDEEVKAVADHWRGQGQPDYITAVTEEPEDGGFAMDGAPEGEDTPEERTYRKAVQLVAENQRASTSWLQRQLRVGYNSAARLIERMEDEGVVARPDHVGRREVLVDQHGQAR